MTEHTLKLIERFFKKNLLVRYKDRETILRAEDAPYGIYYLAKGYVRMYTLTKDGSELTLNIFKPGSFFPLTWAITNIPNTYFYESITRVDIYRAPVEKFNKYVAKNCEVLEIINKMLLYGLNSILVRFQYLIMGNSSQKIANTLLLLGKRFGEETPEGLLIKFKVTHQEVAKLAGLSRETVSIEIKKFMNDGMVRKRGRNYVISNPQKLLTRSFIYVKGVPIAYNY